MTDPVTDHLEQICADAGLPVMAGIFDVLRDRDVLTATAAQNLTAEAVETLYVAHVGPMIDVLEPFVVTHLIASTGAGHTVCGRESSTLGTTTSPAAATCRDCR